LNEVYEGGGEIQGKLPIEKSGKKQERKSASALLKQKGSNSEKL
jgi:hypothetical protein